MDQTHPHTASTALWLTAFMAAAIQMSAFWLVSDSTELETWPPVVALSVVDAALLYLPYAFVGPRRRVWVLLPVALLTFFLLSNLWYVRTFLDLMPFRSYLMVDHTGRFVITGVADAMSASDLWIWLPPLLPAGCWLALRRRIASEPAYGRRSRRLAVMIVVAAFAAGQGYNIFRNHWREAHTHRFRQNIVFYFSRLSSPFTRLGCADYYGWPIYVVHESLSAVGALDFDGEITDADVDEFLAEQRPDGTDELSRYLERRNGRKNLILIIAESLNSDAVGRRVEGMQVTPCLDSIIAADSVVMFRRLRSQARDGRSSDGQLIINTGLLPLRTEATVYHYGRQDFPSLAKAIGGYAFEVIPEPPIWWNHHWTTRSYGFDSLLCNFLPQEADYLRVDTLMMRHAVGMLKRHRAERVYCQFVTIATHDPYSWYDTVATPITAATAKLDPRLRGYLHTVNISDRQIAGFLADLRREGLYDNSIVVIVSDHNARERTLPPGYPEEIFFLALNTGLDLRSDATGGLVDVYPTLIQLLGLTGYHWHGLGQSLLAEPRREAAIDGYGRIFSTPGTAPTDSLLERLERAWRISDHIIRHPR